jgi:hypothetical protein
MTAAMARDHAKPAPKIAQAAASIRHVFAVATMSAGNCS